MLNRSLFSVFTSLVLLAGTGQADHGPGGGMGGGSSVYYLQRQSQQLVNVVQAYGMNYSVQDACRRFDQSVDRLANCSGGGFPLFSGRDNHDPVVGVPGGLPGHGHPGHGGPVIINPVPPNNGFQCRRFLGDARRDFQIVERFLYDSNYDYPQVYRQYLATRQALQNVSLNEGGGNPFPGGGQNYQCVAVDSGWEEHGGGHRGYGRNIEIAQRAAMFECQTYHGSCRLQRCDVVR